MQPLNYRLLIVDDNPSDRLVVKSMLNKLGYDHVQLAESGNVGESKIQIASTIGESYHLILLDWHMPGTSGLKVLKNIRKDPTLRGAKVIIMTGTSSTEVVQEAIENGVNDFIVKPVTIEVLKQKIEKHLKFKQPAT